MSTQRTRTKSFITLMLGAYASACGDAPPEDAFEVGSTKDPLYVDDTALWTGATPWTKVSIPVCWEAATSALTTEKGWARAAVEASWEAYSNVDFTGWGTCPAAGTVTGGLRVTMADRRGASWVGTDGKDAVDGVELNSWVTQGDCAPGFTRQDCIESTAVHEFGHALGFDHEQARPDTNVEGVGYTTDTGAACTQDTNWGGNTEVGDWDANSVMNYCNPARNNAGVLWDVDIAGVQMFYGTKKLSDFGYSAGGWRAAKHVRLVGDVTGDKCADIVGFGSSGVLVAKSTCKNYVKPGEYFGAAATWRANQFDYNTEGWRVERHLRTLADVNADGKLDVVGFADDGVHVALSTGSAFSSRVKWSSDFGAATAPRAWTVAKHPRFMVDVNRDKAADVVGFFDDGVYVALAVKNAQGVYTGFGASTRWVQSYGANAGGWDATKHIRTMADVNNDGRADIVGFGNTDVFVSTSTGSAFNAPVKWVTSFTPNSGGWTLDTHPRLLADVNGDGRADIVGFGSSDVFVSTSTGSAFNAPARWLAGNFTVNGGGWDSTKHLRMVADVNKDGKADIVGFGTKNVQIGMSTGTAFQAARYLAWGYDVNHEWTIAENPRMLADVGNNGYPDVVGFGNDGVHTTDLQIAIDKRGTSE